MRWEDERYVKLYTRDSLTTKRLGWEGRSVLWELFRKVDRAGIAEIGDEEPVQALSGLTGIPEEVCRVAWERLSSGKSPVVTLRDEPSRALFIPNFLPAQKALQSDKARQDKHRELVRVAAITNSRSDKESQSVTESHDRSRGVTLSSAVPSCSDVSRSVDRRGESEGRTVDGCESVDNPIEKPKEELDFAGVSEADRQQVQSLLKAGRAAEAITLLNTLKRART